MEPLYCLALIEAILFVYALIRSKEDFLNPSTTFVAVFAFSTIIAALYCRNWTAVRKYEWNAFLVIFFGNVLVLAIGFFVKRLISKEYYKIDYSSTPNRYVNKQKMIMIILIDIIIVFFSYRYVSSIASHYGKARGGIFGVMSSTYRDIYGHSNLVASEDKMGFGLRYSIYFLQGTAYVFLPLFIYNVFIKKCMFRKNVIYLIPVILFIIYGMICGSRSDIIKVIISGFLVFYIYYMNSDGWSEKNARKIIKKGIKVLMTGLVAFFSASVVIGKSAIGDSLIGSFILHISGYVGAPIIHFNQYLQMQTCAITPGEETLSNLYVFLQNHGFNSVNAVKHLEYKRLRGGIYGNVYTFFRRPLHDFGWIGMLVFTMFFAVIINYLYYRYVRYPKYTDIDKYERILMIYSILFQWVVYAAIDQIGGEFLSISFVIRVVFMLIIYIFVFDFDKGRIRIVI